MQPLLNRERAKQLMDKKGLDVLIAAMPENVFYASGFQSLSQWLIRGKKTMVVVAIDRGGQVTLIGGAGEMDRPACDPPSVDKIISFDYVTIEPGDESTWLPEDRRLAEIALAPNRPGSFWDALGALELRPSMHIAVDDHDLSEGLRQRYKVETTDGRPVFDEIRLIKMPEEVNRLRRAVAITEQAIARSMEKVREGMSEAELGEIFDAEVLAGGGRPYLTCIGFGTFGAYPNHIPGMHKLEKGHLIRWDVGCEYQGYSSDIARMSCLGKPNDLQARRWNAVLAGQLAVLDMVRPGASAAEMYRVGMETTRASGLPEIKRKHLGHGIGIDMYEPPMIAPAETLSLEPGMVFNVEVVFYEFGFGALQVEDTLHVTPGGFECFTELPRKIFAEGD